jgi:hypothetical protein
MISSGKNDSAMVLLPWLREAVMMHIRVAGIVVIGAWAQVTIAQENTEDPKREELDVTLQIIADPDAKLPDEVVRRIPLPARKQDPESIPNAATDERTTSESAQPGQERALEAQELGAEMSQRAKEAAEQRERARRSQADERRNPGPPSEPPRPPRPPRP